jgi:hypothetical protein
VAVEVKFADGVIDGDIISIVYKEDMKTSRNNWGRAELRIQASSA